MPKGKLIVFEGIDGSGKTTQAKLLAQHLTDLGRKVVLTREPALDLTAIKKCIQVEVVKQYHPGPAPSKKLTSHSMGLLQAIDKSEHISRLIAPALREGKTVITDRYIPSSLAYQRVFDGLDRAWLEHLYSFAPRPDVVVLTDMDPKAALARVQGEKNRRYPEFEVLGKQREIRKAYLGLAAGQRNWLVVDASKSKEQVQKEILSVLAKRRLI
jgi:dTMP kinase